MMLECVEEVRAFSSSRVRSRKEKTSGMSDRRRASNTNSVLCRRKREVGTSALSTQDRITRLHSGNNNLVLAQIPRHLQTLRRNTVNVCLKSKVLCFI